MKTLPAAILYSFRRCPYAMRARMALCYAAIKYEMREIILRDKPAHMLEISPKGTVPVLLLPNGQVIEESLDIMLWALSHNDPDEWCIEENLTHMHVLIAHNDDVFKKLLDRYKYPNRYPDEDCTNAREAGYKILTDWDRRIKENGQLFSNKTTLADIAIFPFVRQFAHVDIDWFSALPLPYLQDWLKSYLASDVFTQIMHKYSPWQEGDMPVYINSVA